MQKTDRVGID